MLAWDLCEDLARAVGAGRRHLFGARPSLRCAFRGPWGEAHRPQRSRRHLGLSAPHRARSRGFVALDAGSLDSATGASCRVDPPSRPGAAVIRPLRRLHGVLVATLGCGVAVLYGFALGARTPIPAADLDGLLTPPAQVSARPLAWSISGVVGWWEETPAAVVTVEVSPDLVSPEMLLYCARSSTGESLPTGAWALGAIRPGERRRFALPGGCAPGDELLLFSLGHGLVLGRAQLLSDDGGAG